MILLNLMEPIGNSSMQISMVMLIFISVPRQHEIIPLFTFGTMTSKSLLGLQMTGTFASMAFITFNPAKGWFSPLYLAPLFLASQEGCPGTELICVQKKNYIMRCSNIALVEINHLIMWFGIPKTRKSFSTQMMCLNCQNDGESGHMSHQKRNGFKMLKSMLNS